MMKNQQTSPNGFWRSRWSFILAATASAVGLGNIWRFPNMLEQNGGGAFMYIYILAIILIGIPLMMAEIGLGRNGRRNPFNTMKNIALEGGRSAQWKWLGALGIMAGLIILSYYSVVTGWSLAYFFKIMAGQFTEANPSIVANTFHQFTASPWQLLFWHTVVMITTATMVGLGFERGIENAIRFIFPVMLVLLLILISYSINTTHFSQALSYLFLPNFHELNSKTILQALGQALFTLSLASGSIMMYGAYLPSRASVASSTMAIAFADTLIALLAGIAIFPIVFANHLSLNAGPGLIFKTLPIAFGHMSFGTLFGAIFFIILVFAAFTSTLAMLEPSTAWCIETFNIRRCHASCLTAGCVWLLGIASALSFNYWSSIKVFGLSIFESFDFLAANILLPIGGLLIAIFTVWQLNKDLMRDELRLKHEWVFMLWRFVVRYVTPVCIIAVFLFAIPVIIHNT